MRAYSDGLCRARRCPPRPSGKIVAKPRCPSIVSWITQKCTHAYTHTACALYALRLYGIFKGLSLNGSKRVRGRVRVTGAPSTLHYQSARSVWRDNLGSSWQWQWQKGQEVQKMLASALLVLSSCIHAVSPHSCRERTPRRHCIRRRRRRQCRARALPRPRSGNKTRKKRYHCSFYPQTRGFL